jgi:hypothetical protein
VAASGTDDSGASVATLASETSADPPDDLRTYVTVSRHHSRDIGQRQVIARIDSRPPTTLLFGESFTQEVSPGAHRLRAHNTLVWKKVDFLVEPGEHIEFIVINRSGSVTLGFLTLLGVAPLFLTIERRTIT